MRKVYQPPFQPPLPGEVAPLLGPQHPAPGEALVDQGGDAVVVAEVEEAHRVRAEVGGPALGAQPGPLQAGLPPFPGVGVVVAGDAVEPAPVGLGGARCPARRSTVGKNREPAKRSLGTVITRRPPGRRQRAISARDSSRGGMCSRTQLLSTVWKARVREGEAGGAAHQHLPVGPPAGGLGGALRLGVDPHVRRRPAGAWGGRRRRSARRRSRRRAGAGAGARPPPGGPPPPGSWPGARGGWPGGGGPAPGPGPAAPAWDEEHRLRHWRCGPPARGRSGRTPGGPGRRRRGSPRPG